MGAGRDYVGLFSRLCCDYPLSERVNVPETLRTTWLYHNDYATILQSLPQSIDDQLSRLGRRYLLKHVAKHDQIELTTLTARDHGQGVHPQDL